MATIGTRTLLRTSTLVAALTALLAVSTGDARANQSGPAVNSEIQAAVCRFFGGTPDRGSGWAERSPGSGLSSSGSVCKGGYLDGLNCLNDETSALCWVQMARPEEEVHVAPTAAVGGTDGPVVEEPVIDEPIAGDDIDTQEEPAGPVVEPVVADEAVTGEEPVVIDEPVAEEPMAVEDAGVPATTVEAVVPTVAEEPVVEPATADASVASPATADGGEDA